MAAKKKTENKQNAPVFDETGGIITMDDYVKKATYNLRSNPDNPNGNGGANAINDDVIVRIIDKIFSTDDIDQKTLLGRSNIEGLIEMGAYLAYDTYTYGFFDRVQYSIYKNVLILNKSYQGFGLTKLVEMFKDVYNAVNDRIKAINSDIRLIK
jgi:hypothetical protein